MSGFALILVPALLFILIWLVALGVAKSESSEYGFISYRKFKEYFKPEEWEAPSFYTNKVLIKDDFDKNRMCVESATYLYDGKAMLPSSPYSYIMISRLINKTVDSKKVPEKSSKKNKKTRRIIKW